jgi:anaerobic selenocysteine-containing dehydrogenase
MKQSQNTLWRRWTGPLSADLVRAPAQFGLGQVPARLNPDGIAKVVCGFCSTGCGLNVHLQKGQAVNLSPDPDYPVNLGMACPKGWEALTPLAAPDRAITPLLRNTVTGRLEPTDWDHALQVFTLKFKALLDQHGPESVAWLGTGQIATEELAFLGALGKFGMGLRHGDGNTRQCMATSVTAYKQSFGFDAPPYTYGDFEASDVLVLVGSNLCVAHPILWQRVLRNKNRPQIIVIDPRRTETAMAATQHLGILPKSDLVLLYGTAEALIRRGTVKKDFVIQHTSGFDDFTEFVKQFTPEAVCQATGLSAEVFETFVASIAGGKAVSFWWTMGVNQGHEATRTAQAIINLALMTGNIGRPGTGANSITGQCNAMGSRLFSNTTNLLGGHEFSNPAHREKVAKALRIPAERIPAEDSLAYDQILEAVEAGKIKGLWIVGTNTAHSWIGKGRLDQLFSKLEFLVVQDMYTTTETAHLAHLVLPAAAWGEKEGTFINSERRFGVLKRVARAPGQALSDFQIFRLVAHYWGCEGLFREWTSPEAVFQILKRCSAGQPCDITGIEGYRHLEASGGIQWPHAATSATLDRERRLFSNNEFFTADRKARFIFELPRALPEETDRDFPLTLMTGRGSSAQWHTGTRTNKSEVLRSLAPTKLYVEINPADARRLGLKSGQPARVSTRRGTVEASTVITSTIQPGHIFLPMHFEGTNDLTLPVVDPYSRQPAYKHCAARVERVFKS